jgi:hypothetical protein
MTEREFYYAALMQGRLVWFFPLKRIQYGQLVSGFVTQDGDAS